MYWLHSVCLWIILHLECDGGAYHQLTLPSAIITPTPVLKLWSSSSNLYIPSAALFHLERPYKGAKALQVPFKGTQARFGLCRIAHWNKITLQAPIQKPETFVKKPNLVNQWFQNPVAVSEPKLQCCYAYSVQIFGEYTVYCAVTRFCLLCVM